MDPIMFIVEVAGSILAEVVSDLLMGRTRAARKAEIAAEVERLLSRHIERESRDLKLLVRGIMGEIEILSSRDPDLVVTRSGIKLKHPAQSPRFAGEAELRARIMRLGKLIEQRREELVGPEDVDFRLAPAREGARAQVIDVEWEEVSPKQLESHWSGQLRDLDDKIRRRRQGSA